MKNRLRLVLFLFALLLSALLIFLVLRYRQRTTINYPAVTPISSTEVGLTNYRSQYTAERLIRGYVQAYDRESQTLSIRSQLNPKVEEQIFTVSLPLTQTVYCWPKYNNGVEINKAFILIDPQSLIYIQGEESVLFENISPQIVGKYVFLQTTAQGEIAKLAIIACYE